MTYLLFAVALSLSAVAAWYAIAGLMAIFAASAIPIMIMGSLLESSKLVIASWLYRNWKEIPRLMKIYFTASLIILMMLTSMGIFGFLSKAHLDQAIPSGDVASKLALIDEKIKTEKENINASRKELTQLDAQVDQTLSRTTEASGADRAISIRRGQQKDRARILKEIGDSQTKIAKYNEERAPIASEVRKVEAEVGPIKYIAALLYGDNPEADVLEKAVRFVIIMIVMVFDPLAVLLLVAANWNQKREDEIKEELESPLYVADVTIPEPEELPKHTEMLIEDDITTEDTQEFNTTEIIHEEVVPVEDHIEVSSVEQEQEDELHISDIEAKDWEPELYDRLRTKTYWTPKAHHFLSKVRNIFASPGVQVNTIEKDVEDLQKPK
jgi:hypothetical protein